MIGALILRLSADDGAAADSAGSAAAEAGTPAASHQGSGNAGGALEAFLDSAAQPSNRNLRQIQSYSK